METVVKVNNKDTTTMSLTSFLCFYTQLRIDFTHYSAVSILDFEQVNAGWDDFTLTVKSWTKTYRYIFTFWLLFRTSETDLDYNHHKKRVRLKT